MTKPQSIAKFLDQQSMLALARSSWVDVPDLHLEVYLRKSKRIIAGQARETIDVANLVVETEHWRKGNATKFYERIEAEADARNLVVFIENAHLDFMRKMHVRRGYQPCEGYALCYFRLPKVSQ